MENVLIPILTEKESDDVLVTKLRDKEKVVLLFVIDQRKFGDEPAASVGEKIKKAEAIMDEIRNKLPKAITIKDYVEWGDWVEKIESISKLEEIEQVLMVESGSSRSFCPLLKIKGIGFDVINL